MKVIAFDLFGTVLDLRAADHEDVKRYAEQIHCEKWAPLSLPKTWEHLPAFVDSAQGIWMLRKNYIVVTCSNAPVGLQCKMLKNAGVVFDGIIPLELSQVYKPNPLAYKMICTVLDVEPADVLMVSANEKFGDLETSVSIGMKSQLIRSGAGNPKTIIDLANSLKESR